MDETELGIVLFYARVESKVGGVWARGCDRGLSRADDFESLFPPAFAAPPFGLSPRSSRAIPQCIDIRPTSDTGPAQAGALTSG